jgi:hypothetical protein
MAKQTSIFDNDFSEYFDLFQKQTDYSNKILENAKKIKQNIQELFRDVDFSMNDINTSMWIFDFDVILTQVSEQPEPNSLKLFTRQYTPVVKVYKNNSFVNTIIFNDETKYIHKHINELFVGESVSQEYFFDVAHQYFLLDFLYKQLQDGNFTNFFISKVKEFCTDYEEINNNIICVNCKLRGRKMPDKINPNLHSVISHINSLWKILTSKSKYSIIGNYKNYLNENELIRLLNDSKSRFISETISDYFQNDFLLLNNMEFMNNEKPYTKDWDNRIITPLLIEKKNEKKYLKDINGIKQNKDNIFLFQKIKPDGIFYKTEIYIPENDMSQDNFNKIVSLSMDLLKLKEREK